MKKGMRIFILFLLSLCIYGQTLQTMPVYAATGKKIVATKKASISKRKKTLKKKNKISVIVHSTSKAGVSTTKKVTVKKETMKKAATKTASTTKKTTSKKKSTKKTGSVTVTTETTVVTTVKTSTKKKSKIKTIETTIVTTVKTTRITTSSPATGTGTTGGSGFSISKFTDVKGHINPKLYNAFITLGFQFKINPSLSTTGVFSVQQHNENLIILQKPFEKTFYVGYMLPREYQIDIRNSVSATWRDVFRYVLYNIGGKAHYKEIAEAVKGYKKSEKNNNVEAKARQTLRQYTKTFTPLGNGYYKLVA